MKSLKLKSALYVICLHVFMLSSAAAQSAPEPSVPQAQPLWELQISPGATYHFSRSDEHKPVYVLALERRSATGDVHGAAFFTNSFGQPTVYWHPWGQHYPDVLGVPGLFAKWTAGPMYGYVGKYKDKVPLNYKGLSPAIVPTVGYQLSKDYSLQLNILGTAGLMLAFSGVTSR